MMERGREENRDGKEYMVCCKRDMEITSFDVCETCCCIVIKRTKY